MKMTKAMGMAAVLVTGLVGASSAHAGAGDAQAIQQFLGLLKPGTYKSVDSDNKCILTVKAGKDHSGHPIVSLKMKAVDSEGKVEKAQLRFAPSSSLDVNISLNDIFEGELARLVMDEELEYDPETEYTKFRVSQAIVDDYDGDGLIDVTLRRDVVDYESDPSEEMVVGCGNLRKVK